MAEYYKGTVRQATRAAETLTWASSHREAGNELKMSFLSEADVTLDNSKFHISIPLDGTEQYRVDGQLYKLNAGEYFIHNPQQHLRAEGNFGKEVKGICIYVTEKTLAEVYHSHQKQGENMDDLPSIFPWVQHHSIVKKYSLSENHFGQYLRQLTAHILNKNQPPLMDWDAFYYGIAEALLREYAQIGWQMQAIPYSKSSTKEELFKRISIAHSYILDNYAQPTHIDEIAKAALLSSYQLVRLYRHIYMMTPYQHILHLRVEKAKELLAQDYSPTEVAYMLSFSDRRAFGKVFKKMTGVAPSEW